MTPKELIKRLETAGWIEVRRESSHRVFRHPDNPKTSRFLIMANGTLNQAS